MEDTLHRRYGCKEGRLIKSAGLITIIPILFLAAFLYPYLPGRDITWCAIKLCTGVECPGCGMTRSISSLVHGQFVQSVGYHPLGVFLSGWLIYKWADTVRARIAGKKDRPLMDKKDRIFSCIFLTALFIVWVVKFI